MDLASAAIRPPRVAVIDPFDPQLIAISILSLLLNYLLKVIKNTAKNLIIAPIIMTQILLPMS